VSSVRWEFTCVEELDPKKIDKGNRRLGGQRRRL